MASESEIRLPRQVDTGIRLSICLSLKDTWSCVISRNTQSRITGAKPDTSWSGWKTRAYH